MAFRRIPQPREPGPPPRRLPDEPLTNPLIDPEALTQEIEDPLSREVIRKALQGQPLRADERAVVGQVLSRVQQEQTTEDFLAEIEAARQQSSEVGREMVAMGFGQDEVEKLMATLLFANAAKFLSGNKDALETARSLTPAQVSSPGEAALDIAFQVRPRLQGRAFKMLLEHADARTIVGLSERISRYGQGLDPTRRRVLQQNALEMLRVLVADPEEDPGIDEELVREMERQVGLEEARRVGPELRDEMLRGFPGALAPQREIFRRVIGPVAAGTTQATMNLINTAIRFVGTGISLGARAAGKITGIDALEKFDEDFLQVDDAFLINLTADTVSMASELAGKDPGEARQRALESIAAAMSLGDDEEGRPGFVKGAANLVTSIATIGKGSSIVLKKAVGPATKRAARLSRIDRLAALDPMGRLSQAKKGIDFLTANSIIGYGLSAGTDPNLSLDERHQAGLMGALTFPAMIGSSRALGKVYDKLTPQAQRLLLFRLRDAGQEVAETLPWLTADPFLMEAIQEGDWDQAYGRIGTDLLASIIFRFPSQRQRFLIEEFQRKSQTGENLTSDPRNLESEDLQTLLYSWLSANAENPNISRDFKQTLQDYFGFNAADFDPVHKAALDELLGYVQFNFDQILKGEADPDTPIADFRHVPQELAKRYDLQSKSFFDFVSEVVATAKENLQKKPRSQVRRRLIDRVKTAIPRADRQDTAMVLQGKTPEELSNEQLSLAGKTLEFAAENRKFKPKGAGKKRIEQSFEIARSLEQELGPLVGSFMHQLGLRTRFRRLDEIAGDKLALSSMSALDAMLRRAVAVRGPDAVFDLVRRSTLPSAEVLRLREKLGRFAQESSPKSPIEDAALQLGGIDLDMPANRSTRLLLVNQMRMKYGPEEFVERMQTFQGITNREALIEHARLLRRPAAKSLTDLPAQAAGALELLSAGLPSSGRVGRRLAMSVLGHIQPYIPRTSRNMKILRRFADPNSPEHMDVSLLRLLMEQVQAARFEEAGQTLREDQRALDHPAIGAAISRARRGSDGRILKEDAEALQFLLRQMGILADVSKIENLPRKPLEAIQELKGFEVRVREEVLSRREARERRAARRRERERREQRARRRPARARAPVPAEETRQVVSDILNFRRDRPRQAERIGAFARRLGLEAPEGELSRDFIAEVARAIESNVELRGQIDATSEAKLLSKFRIDGQRLEEAIQARVVEAARQAVPEEARLTVGRIVTEELQRLGPGADTKVRASLDLHLTDSEMAQTLGKGFEDLPIPRLAESQKMETAGQWARLLLELRGRLLARKRLHDREIPRRDEVLGALDAQITTLVTHLQANKSAIKREIERFHKRRAFNDPDSEVSKKLLEKFVFLGSDRMKKHTPVEALEDFLQNRDHTQNTFRPQDDDRFTIDPFELEDGTFVVDVIGRGGARVRILQGNSGFLKSDRVTVDALRREIDLGVPPSFRPDIEWFYQTAMMQKRESRSSIMFGISPEGEVINRSELGALQLPKLWNSGGIDLRLKDFLMLPGQALRRSMGAAFDLFTLGIRKPSLFVHDGLSGTKRRLRQELGKSQLTFKDMMVEVLPELQFLGTEVSRQFDDIKLRRTREAKRALRPMIPVIEKWKDNADVRRMIGRLLGTPARQFAEMIEKGLVSREIVADVKKMRQGLEVIRRAQERRIRELLGRGEISREEAQRRGLSIDDPWGILDGYFFRLRQEHGKAWTTLVTPEAARIIQGFNMDQFHPRRQTELTRLAAPAFRRKLSEVREGEFNYDIGEVVAQLVPNVFRSLAFSEFKEQARILTHGHRDILLGRGDSGLFYAARGDLVYRRQDPGSERRVFLGEIVENNHDDMTITIHDPQRGRQEVFSYEDFKESQNRSRLLGIQKVGLAEFGKPLRDMGNVAAQLVRGRASQRRRVEAVTRLVEEMISVEGKTVWDRLIDSLTEWQYHSIIGFLNPEVGFLQLASLIPAAGRIGPWLITGSRRALAARAGKDKEVSDLWDRFGHFMRISDERDVRQWQKEIGKARSSGNFERARRLSFAMTNYLDQAGRKMVWTGAYLQAKHHGRPDWWAARYAKQVEAEAFNLFGAHYSPAIMRRSLPRLAFLFTKFTQMSINEGVKAVSQARQRKGANRTGAIRRYIRGVAAIYFADYLISGALGAFLGEDGRQYSIIPRVGFEADRLPLIGNTVRELVIENTEDVETARKLLDVPLPMAALFHSIAGEQITSLFKAITAGNREERERAMRRLRSLLMTRTGSSLWTVVQFLASNTTESGFAEAIRDLGEEAQKASPLTAGLVDVFITDAEARKIEGIEVPPTEKTHWRFIQGRPAYDVSLADLVIADTIPVSPIERRRTFLAREAKRISDRERQNVRDNLASEFLMAKAESVRSENDSRPLQRWARKLIESLPEMGITNTRQLDSYIQSIFRRGRPGIVREMVTGRAKGQIIRDFAEGGPMHSLVQDSPGDVLLILSLTIPDNFTLNRLIRSRQITREEVRLFGEIFQESVRRLRELRNQ